ncbi:hypothetical protein [Spiroplasma endosymbiont of Cantharis rufa]|uniref:hypothetical protein n=1 Tax=Spiroplasma endosymbiont of Cantharis rufa TaxID=3066279 RepID=UPI0030D316C7
MKKKKVKKKSENNKFGVFNGSVINSETIGINQEFAIEDYKDSSLTISEIKSTKSINKKNDNNVKNKKRKTNYLIYKITAYIIILLLIILLIVWFVIT